MTSAIQQCITRVCNPSRHIKRGARTPSVLQLSQELSENEVKLASTGGGRGGVEGQADGSFDFEVRGYTRVGRLFVC